MFRSVHQRIRSQQHCCIVQMRECITAPNENLGTCQRSTLEITNNLLHQLHLPLCDAHHQASF